MACNNQPKERSVERAFYYWKSAFNINDSETVILNQLQVKTLYVKLFDVDWDGNAGKPVPVAKLTSNGYQLPADMKVISTVFITNECMQHLDSAGAVQLAGDISLLIKNISTLQHFPQTPPEIQIDCDWTMGTRPQYFVLLKTIKQLNPVSLSATIRLHQVKFISSSGIPPVDKGLLMCYNMGNLKNPATKNSIIDATELNRYIGSLGSYPLPLDVAFPLFNWRVLFRDNQYAGLVKDLPDSLLDNSFTTKSSNSCQFLKDTLLKGYSFKKGDMLRDEQSSFTNISDAAAAINQRLKNTHLRVVLYHLDAVLLSKYSAHELEAIYNSLR